MNKLGRWKFLMPLTLAVLFITAMMPLAWANEFAVTPDPVIIASTANAVIANDAVAGVAVLPVANTIVLTAPDAGSFSTAAGIRLIAPAGTRFDTSGALPVFTPTGAVTINGLSPYPAVLGDFSSSNTQLDVTFTAGNVLPLQTVTITGLVLLPTTASTANDVNTPNVTMTVVANQDSTLSITANVGDFDLLSHPYIVSAAMVDSTHVNVTFNVNIDTPSATDPAKYRIQPGDSNSYNAGAAARKTGTLNTVKLTLGGPCPPLNFTTPDPPTVKIRFLGNIANNDGVLVTSNTINEVLIVQPSAAISSVEVDKAGEKVGLRWEAGQSSLPGNQVTATFTATSGQPFKFKLVRVSDTATDPAPLYTARVGSVDITALIGGLPVTMENPGQGTNQYFNEDIYLINGPQNTGTVTVVFTLGTAGDAFNAPGDTKGKSGGATYAPGAPPMAPGDEVQVKIIASTDEWETFTSSDPFIVDFKAPTVITSGADRPIFLDRNTIRFKFNEPMDSATIGNVGLWRLRGAGILYPVVTAVLDADQQTLTLTSASVMPLSTPIQVRVMPPDGATPVVGIEDTQYNTVPLGALTGAPLATSPSGELTSVTIGNSVVGCTKISNNANLIVVTLYAPTGLPLNDVFARVFDADNTTVAQSGTNSWDTGLAETTPGVYKGILATYPSLTASNVVLWMTTAPDLPSLDWTNKIVSNTLAVDNTLPHVIATATYDATNNSVQVSFDKPMNATDLNQGVATGDYSVLDTLGGSIDVMNVTVAPDKESVDLGLLQSPDPARTYVVDLTNFFRDDAGNQIIDVDTVGIDRAQFTTSSVALTATPDTLNVVSGGAAATAIISGGAGTYTIETAPTDPAVHASWLTSDTLNVSVDAGVTVAFADSVVITDGSDSVTVTINVTTAPTCGPDHPDLCTTEADCTGAGLNWCDGVCQVAPCCVPQPPPTETNVGLCDTTCQATAPVTATGVDFCYTAPVTILVGAMDATFTQVWWLNSSCEYTTDFAEAASGEMTLSCSVDAPADAEWLFWFVTAEDLATLDWENGAYDLLFYSLH